jgi:hypothetical protein
LWSSCRRSSTPRRSTRTSGDLRARLRGLTLNAVRLVLATICAGLGRTRSSRTFRGKRLSASGRSSRRPTRSPRRRSCGASTPAPHGQRNRRRGPFNDATALVAHRVAVAAVMAGSFSLAEAGLEFVLERPAARDRSRGRVDRRRDPLAHHRRQGQRPPSRSRGCRSESRRPLRRWQSGSARTSLASRVGLVSNETDQGSDSFGSRHSRESIRREAIPCRRRGRVPHPYETAEKTRRSGRSGSVRPDP